MFFKVTWLTVMVLLILPEKDMAKAQNTDLTNAESRAWRRSDTSDLDLPTNMQPPDEINQEPMRRRRRKRKRRPQQQQPEQNYQLSEADRMNYWHGEVDEESDHDTGGITVSVNGVKGIQNINTEVWHDENDRSRVNYPKRNEFVQTMVMQVEGTDDGVRQEDVTNKSYRKPYVAPKKEDVNVGASGDKTASDLKNLLKNSGGLSLSEILQKQNLSLDDLLKGKQNAFKVLQNTAAPSPTESVLETKGVQRLPAKRPVSTAATKEQFEIPSPVSEDSKQTRRLPNFYRPKIDPTIVESAATQDESKFMVPPSPTENLNADSSVKPKIYETVTIASTNVRTASGNRRLPASSANEKAKPIKEVVSGIRPDLSNSNSRRRLLPIKFRSNAVNTTSVRPDVKERLPPRYGTAPKLGSVTSANKTRINYEQPIAPTELTTTEDEVVATTTSFVSTTTVSPVAQENREVVKDIVRSRLALKPRLKIPHLQPNPTTPTTTTTTTTTFEPAVDDDSIEMKSVELSSESNEETSTAYTIDENLSGDEEEKLLFSSEEDFKEFLDKSEPEVNSILEEFALFNGRKAVVPIEDLFEDPQGVRHENVQTLTSRSDLVTVTDRTKEMQRNSGNVYQQGNSKFFNGKIDITERNPSLFSDITSPRTTDDKTDILELLDDRRGGAKLTKVLEQRNMTLEELLEHRKRGSSQLHLSEIINNKTRPPFNNVHAADKLDIVAAFENFPNFNLPNVKSVKPDDVRTDSDGSSYFTSIINIKPTDEISKEGRSLNRDQFIKSIPPTDDYHPWKKLNYPSQDVNYIDSVKRNIISSSQISPFDDTDVLQIENEVARSHDFVDLELSGHGFKPNSVPVETASIPVGVRSAIIASASIVGICLMIFILIFATCRWRQKQRKKLNYNENFQTVRGRLPILARNSSSSSSTKRSASPNGIFTTLGSRSSKLNTMDPNSPEVQDYLYDAMRKSFR